MPNPTLSPPKVIQKVALDVISSPLIEGTGLPMNLMRWNICGTQPALTQLHYSAGRWGTWVRCLKGVQIWFVLDGPLPEKGLAEFNISEGKFIYFVLEPDSLLVLPPGTPYAVLNATDCVAEGGHMFLASSLVKSFNIGLREHVLGHQDTKAFHILSEAVLHSIWKHYYLAIERVLKGIQQGQPTGTPGTPDIRNVPFDVLQQSIPKLPSLENLVALMVMCVHANAFEPAVPEGRAKPQAPLSLLRQRMESQNFWKQVHGIADLWERFSAFEDMVDAVERSIGRQPVQQRFTVGIPLLEGIYC